jgi:hypothetical protein
MTQAIVFVSTCPSCKREQPQDAFSVADLLRLLNGGHPIEAYCVPCDKFWSISVQERVELGEAVAIVSNGTPLLNGSCHPTRRRRTASRGPAVSSRNSRAAAVGAQNQK